VAPHVIYESAGLVVPRLTALALLRLALQAPGCGTAVRPRPKSPIPRLPPSRWKDVFELTEWFRPGTIKKDANFDPNKM
jgi:hypothetical protein